MSSGHFWPVATNTHRQKNNGVRYGATKGTGGDAACNKEDTINITSGIPDPVAPAEGVARAVKAGVPFARVTVSSDGNGSQPLFDGAGKLTGIGVAGFESLLETVQSLVNDYGFALTDALRPLTTSVAAFLNLSVKGNIAPGKDADLLVMTPELCINQVYARGKQMVVNGKACVKGTFE